MNKGLLDESSLQKNIEKIELYNEEEQKCLNKINEFLNKCANIYNSNNQNKFLEAISDFPDNIVKINNKRNAYVSTLNKVMYTYASISEQVVNKFNGE